MDALPFVSSSIEGIRAINEPLYTVHDIGNPTTVVPQVSLPLRASNSVDISPYWSHLDEVATYYDLPIPSEEELARALADFMREAANRGDAATLISATISVTAPQGRSQFLILGEVISPFSAEPISIRVDDSVSGKYLRKSGPEWVQMAHRTNSRAELDQIARWLAADGYSDVASGAGAAMDAPLFGSCIFLEGDEWTVLEQSDRPFLMLHQMKTCGIIRDGFLSPPADTKEISSEAACWWISPSYVVHPVSAIQDVRLNRFNSRLIPAFIDGAV